MRRLNSRLGSGPCYWPAGRAQSVGSGYVTYTIARLPRSRVSATSRGTRGTARAEVQPLADVERRHGQRQQVATDPQHGPSSAGVRPGDDLACVDADLLGELLGTRADVDIQPLATRVIL
jgi:hypothetical protein